MNLEEADRTAADAVHVVEFELGDEVCAVDIQAVDSIVEPKQVTRVPRAPDAVEGVMDLRGETTAIVDPREFLAIDGDRDSENILVLDRADDKQKVGLRVAAVTEVSGYPDGQVDGGETVERIDTAAVERDFVNGIIRKLPEDLDEDESVDDVDVDLVLWLDVDALVDAVSDGGNGDNQH